MSALASIFGLKFGCRHRLAAGWSRLAAMILVVLGSSLGTRWTQAAEAPQEYQIKAVFLFRLAQFVEWPTNAFSEPTSPVIIGVLGADPFGEALDIAVQGETAGGRALAVQRFQRVEDAKNCHMLFICKSEAAKIKDILPALEGRPVLTVSDVNDFAPRHKGMICLVTDQNKVKLRVDPRAAKKAGLVLNSRLLRMAEVVPGN